ncbi:hypothetical protein LCGC14_2609470, partial [marine sediment metagenome]
MKIKTWHEPWGRGAENRKSLYNKHLRARGGSKTMKII